MRTTHMKNLDICREPLKNTTALFYLLPEQQPFTILSIYCTMEMLTVTLRVYLIFYCKPLRQCIHISCPFTAQFTFGDKSERNLFQLSYSYLTDTFQLTCRSCQKGNQGLRTAFFFQDLKGR